jgi:nucleoside-diphosphate-sugar epimerase
MKALVTGGGGFLGRYVVQKLCARGAEVAILGRSPQPVIEAQGVKVYQGEIENYKNVKEASQGCDVVFHIAAKAGIWGSWNSFFQTNVIGTRNVINACKEQEITRLIYTSTPSVVFNGDSIEGADESLPYGRNWLSHYAHTKAIAEAEILAANNDEGLRTIALRPHLIWGIGDPHLVPRIVERARAGKLRIIGNGDNRVDITHVENAAHAHLLACDALENGNAEGKPYFISQDQPVVLWEWINELLTRLNIRPVQKKISLNKAYVLGLGFEAFYKLSGLSSDPPMTRFLAVELAKNHFFKIDAARRDLGYEPAINIETGLNQLVEHLNKTGVKN